MRRLARYGIAAAAVTCAAAVMIAHAVRAELRREAEMDAAEDTLAGEGHGWLIQPSDPPPMVFKPKETRVSRVRETGWDPCGGGPIRTAGDEAA